MAMLHPPFKIRVNGLSDLIFSGEERGAASCYSEIVVEDCYRLFRIYKSQKPKVIVDIGANIGVFSKLCSLLFPGADIYAYEPNPAAFEWLCRNAAGTRIHCFNCAVREEGGAAKIDTFIDSTLTRITPNGNTEVQCTGADQVAERLSIDLMKIDCEGSEWSILRETSLLQRTRDFCLEYHLDDAHTLPMLKAMIEEGGHEILEVQATREEGKYGLLRSRLRTNRSPA